ncbi:ABC transporter permease [Aerophototrophica crusticola]|uniref:ABC transporter permease n=1 Tax=Aerophototrophica crusticola TaxID=1709002 RepID=A0A858R738_9PROT|nr:ABC transporter permease [Rhodospirillaceae bacterium B3]
MTADPAPGYRAPPLPDVAAFSYDRGDRSPGAVRRIWAMVLRNWFLIRTSWPRMLELCYWPTVQLLIWGFLSQFLRTNSSYVAQAVGVLVGAVLLWEVLVRTQIGMSVTFLEELWSRNLGNLFVSPLRPWEWVASLVVLAWLRVLIGLSLPIFLAMPLFGFSIFDLGFPLIGFFANLMLMGITIGLITSGLILRNGLGAEGLAWMAVFVLAPVSAVYYPVSSLPLVVQYISLALPSTHVFEGMRSVLFGQGMRWDHLGWAVLLNLLYGALAVLYFLSAFRDARQRGALLQAGE